MKELELLSPAKNLEFGKAAINYGADAVYIGADNYGARRAASNTTKDIESLCIYAHKFNSKVYAAVNTIIKDNEFKDAVSLIWDLWKAGCDAVIIQDLGLLEASLPPIRIFASTQTHNYDLDRVKMLDNAGMDRIILARELSLEQIKTISQETKCELECFVHGALCVSFSGQCYLSALTSNRSANRGNCSQPCRLPYTLEDSNGKIIAENKHLLSLKDLNLSSRLNDLIDAGISSFKIEGRLKDINYVKNITAFYREKLDDIIALNDNYKRSSSGRTEISFSPDPEKTFYRGGTAFFINDRKQGIMSANTPKSIGKFIGTVREIKERYIVTQEEIEINAGDGLCYFDAEGILQGFHVNSAVKILIYPFEIPEDITVGTKLYRNQDKEFEDALARDKSKRQIDINIRIKETETGFEFAAEDEDGNCSSVEYPFDKIEAQNPESINQSINDQLSKSGNTIFRVMSVMNELSKVYFMKKSELNLARRELLEKLEEERSKNYKHINHSVREEDNPDLEKTSKYRRYLDYKANVSNKKAESFYNKRDYQIKEPAFELLKNKEDKVIMTSRHCLRYEFGMCKIHQNGEFTEATYPLWLTDGINKYKLDFDCERCEMKIKS